MADFISIQLAEATVNAGSTVTATVNFRTRSTGAASTPSSIRYRVDCLTSKNALVEWTSVAAASAVTITVPGTSNEIVSANDEVETRQITVEADTDLSTQFRSAATWKTRNIRNYPALFEFPTDLLLEPYFPVDSLEAALTIEHYQYPPGHRFRYLDTFDVLDAHYYRRTAAEISAGVTPVSFQIPSHLTCGYFMPERYGTNTTPGTTVMQTAVEACVAVAVQAGGGTVLLSDRYKMSGPLAGAAAVDIFGTGEGSTLEFPAGHGITIAWLTGFGSVTYDNFQLIGAGGGNYNGIYQAGTLDDADELYGLTLRNLLSTNWNVGVKLRTVRNLEIESCWIQDVDRGIELIGKCIVVHITKNKVVKAAGGGGTGTSRAIYLESFNYTSGTGVVPPEGIQIFDNLLYGFETVLEVATTNVLNFRDNDTQSTVYGVLFHTVQHVFNIVGNFFDMSGAGVLAGVYGQGLGSEVTAKINIKDNGFNATTVPAAAIGVKINDTGNQNQNHVTTEGNYFSGDWDGGDIVYNNAGHGAILNNRCQSPTPTNSIAVSAVISGCVTIDGNHCAKEISYDTAEVASGEVIVGQNIKNGTTQIGGMLFGSATFNPADLADGVGETTTVTVTGAALGDLATATFSLDLQGITMTAWVSATNTVSVRFQNETTGNVNLASGTLRAQVTQRVAA